MASILLPEISVHGLYLFFLTATRAGGNSEPVSQLLQPAVLNVYGNSLLLMAPVKSTTNRWG